MGKSVRGKTSPPDGGNGAGGSGSPAAGFAPGGHVSCIYERPEERDEVLLGFLRSGLENNGNVLHVGGPPVVESLDRMDAGDVDVRACLSGGRLKTVPVERIRRTGEDFDPDGLIALVNDEAELAASEGRSALWISCDMGMLFESGKELERMLECEAILESFSRNRGCSVLCIYDRLRVEPDMLTAAVVGHPSVLFGTEACDNPQFVSPRDVAKCDVKSLALDFIARGLLSCKEGTGAPGNGEREYRQLLESIQHGVIILDTEGNFLDCNEYAHVYMGYTREEFLSLNIFEMAAPGHDTLAEEDRERLLKGESIIVHRNLRRKDGTIMLVEIRVRGIRHRGKKAFLAVAHDLTRGLKTECSLEDREYRYRKLCSELTDYAFVVRVENGRPVEFVHDSNSGALTGYAPDELVNLPDSWLGIVHEDDRAGVGDFLARTAAGGAAERMEYRIIRKDGNVRWVECAAVPHRNCRGEVITLDCLVRDVTERIRTREELEQSEEKFAKAFYDCGQIMSITEIESGKYLEVSNEFVRVTGFSRDEVIGRTSVDIGILSAETRREIVDALAENGRVSDMEIKVKTKDGRELVALYNGVIVTIAGERRLLSVARDITEREKAESEREKLLRELNDRVRKLDCLYGLSRIADKEDLSNDEMFRELLNILRGSLEHPDEAYPRIVYGGKEYRVDDFRETSRKCSAEVRLGGEAVGTIEVFYADDVPDACLKGEKELLGMIAGQLGRVMERMKAEEELREREAFNFALFEYNPAEIVVVDREGRIVKTNLARRENRDGLPEIGGVMFRDYAGGYELDMYPEMMNCMRRNEVRKFPEQRCGDRYVSITISPFPDGAIIISEDVTDRMKAENRLIENQLKLEQLLKYEKVISEYASRLNSSASFHDVIGELLLSLAEKMHYRHVCMKISDPGEEGIDTYSWGTPNYIIEGEGSLTEYFLGVDYVKEKIKKGEAFCVPNLFAVRAPERKFLKNLGIGSFCLFPLFIRDRVRGVFCLTKDRQFDWDREWEFIRTLTEIVANAWEKQCLFRASLEAEKKQVQAVKMAERVSRLASLGTLAAGIAHEINQPLNALAIAVDGMLYWEDKNYDIPKEEMDQNLRFISEQVKRIDDIITNMRAMAKQEKIKTPVPVDVNKVVRRVCGLVREKMSAHGIAAVLNLEDDIPPIRGNPTQVQQVVSNLVVNAINALERSERRDKRVVVSTRRSGDNLVLEVLDNGPGIPEENIDHLFDPFFTTSASSEGMGLGLFITHNIVSGLNGIISVENVKEGGARFVVSIPVTKENAEERA